MRMSSRWIPVLGMVAWLVGAPAAHAQVFGTFPWQMQPYCNTVTLTLSNSPTGFTLEGVDDQCGATNKGSAIGTASFNGAGNVTLSFTIVAAPGGRPVSVSAVVSPANGDGTWTDSNGYTGTFKLLGAAGGLPPRPDGNVFFRSAGHTNALSAGRVVWNLVSENVGGGAYDAATGRYTAPATGLYSITYSVGYSPSTAGRACAYVATPTISPDRASCIPIVAGTSFLSLSGATVIPVTAGQTIEVQSNITGSASLLSSSSGITIMKVR